MPAAWQDPDLAMHLAKEVQSIYGESTARLLRLVASRLARGIDQPGWAEAKLLEQHALREQARRIVDLLDVMGPDAIERAITAAHEVGLKGAAVELRATGITGGFGATNTRAVEALAREAVAAVRSTHPSILRAVDDVYRTVIARTSPQVLTGTVTRRQAAQATLNDFADRGIGGFTDRAGKQWRLESYAEMSTRTAVGQAQVQGTLDQFADHDRDLVIVSDAPGECHLCRPFEGKVLSISGRDDRYPSVASAKASGLLHSNCRHRLSAYVEGLTRPMEHTADPEGDRLRQEQRYLERGVRQWKRRAAAALDEPTRKAAEAKAREWSARLKQHVDDNGLKRLRYREQVTSAI